MHQALSGHPDVQLVNLGKTTFDRSRPAIKRLARKFRPSAVRYLSRFAARAKRHMQRASCDVLFAPVASSEIFQIAEFSCPLVFATDATPGLLQHFYGSYANDQEYRRAVEREEFVISKCSRAIYSSKWAAEAAMSEFGISEDKISRVAFGANLDSIPPANLLTHDTSDGTCRLLFVGKNWQRKGGQIAVDTVHALNDEFDVPAHLTILGCKPPNVANSERIRIIPYLNKNVPSQQDEIIRLLLNSHFFILPTRADCSPIVMCEANAYGLPVISTDVGGVPCIIRNGVNGMSLPLNSNGSKFAETICSLFRNSDYTSLVESSRREYDTRLNWGAWAEQVVSILKAEANGVRITERHSKSPSEVKGIENCDEEPSNCDRVRLG